MIIYRTEGEVLIDIEVDDNSYRRRELMGDEYLSLSFALDGYVDIPVGSYCDIGNDRYTIETPPSVSINSRREFVYSARFDSVREKLKQRVFLNTVDYRINFALTAKPHEHLKMLVDNLNRLDVGGWSSGTCIQGDEKCIVYDKISCWEALQLIADTFETEFDIVGKTISLSKIEYNKLLPLQLAYGKGNGLRSGVTRTSQQEEQQIDYLYVQGGEQNIDKSTYGSRMLHLPPPTITYLPFRITPQTIRYDGYRFEDEQGFNSGTAVTYLCIGNVVIRESTDPRKTEGCIDCTHIYPKRVGEVSGVTVTPPTSDDLYALYDITDDSIPQSLDYKDYMIAGETTKIVFQSGMLAGKEFDVDDYIHDADATHPARTFLLKSAEIDGEVMPNETYTPAVGDKYAVFGCTLPSSYICDNSTRTGASWEMFREAVRHLHDRNVRKFTFRGSLDEIWVRENWLSDGHKFRAGGCVVVFDDDVIGHGVGFASRITSVKDYINNPYKIEIELSNTLRKQSRKRRFSDLLGIITQQVSAIDAAMSVQSDVSTREINREINILEQI